MADEAVIPATADALQATAEVALQVMAADEPPALGGATPRRAATAVADRRTVEVAVLTAAVGATAATADRIFRNLAPHIQRPSSTIVSAETMSLFPGGTHQFRVPLFFAIFATSQFPKLPSHSLISAMLLAE